MAKLTIDFGNAGVLPDTMADEAERIGGMIRDGFTSGELGGGWRGWWTFDGAMDDSDLEEPAEGETCDGCGRPSLDCSRDPCDDVREDRGDATRWRVTLEAKGVDVTGAPGDVERLALEDARAFADAWTYTLADIEEAQDSERTDPAYGADFTATETRRRGGVSTFTIAAAVIVTAADEAEAEAAARALLAKESRPCCI